MIRNETLRCEWVNCGRCRSCPHGPYWYAYWRDNGRTRKRYIGRKPPTSDEGPRIHRHWNAILWEATATRDLACEILGCFPNPTDLERARKVAFAPLHRWQRKNHWELIVASAAYGYLKTLFRQQKSRKKRRIKPSTRR